MFWHGAAGAEVEEVAAAVEEASEAATWVEAATWAQLPPGAVIGEELVTWAQLRAHWGGAGHMGAAPTGGGHWGGGGHPGMNWGGGHSGTNWGGGHWGGGHGGGGHSGDGHNHSHGAGCCVIGIGVGLGWGYGWGWGWGGPYYYPPYYYPPSYYPPYSYGYSVGVAPPVYVQRQDLEPAAPPPSYWYYCRNPEGYYPSVKECSEGWIQVVPQPPDQ